MISDGQLIAGSSHTSPSINNVISKSASTLQINMAKAFFVYDILAVWDAAGMHPFGVDFGYTYDNIDPFRIYIDVKTM